MVTALKEAQRAQRGGQQRIEKGELQEKSRGFQFTYLGRKKSYGRPNHNHYDFKKDVMRTVKQILRDIVIEQPEDLGGHG